MRLLTRKLPTVSILIAFGAICFGCVLIKTVHTQDLIRKFFFLWWFQNVTWRCRFSISRQGLRSLYGDQSFLFIKHSDRYGDDVIWGTVYYDPYQKVKDQGTLPKLCFGLEVIKPENFSQPLANHLEHLDISEPPIKKQKA